MKIKAISSLILSCIISTQAWSYGTEIFLGTHTFKPGESLALKISDLEIYERVNYNINCKIEQIAEDSMILLETNVRSITININANCTSDTYTKQCALEANKPQVFSFEQVRKNNSQIVSFKNLDFTQEITVSCSAKATL